MKAYQIPQIYICLQVIDLNNSFIWKGNMKLFLVFSFICSDLQIIVWRFVLCSLNHYVNYDLFEGGRSWVRVNVVPYQIIVLVFA
jgi:hypothetical protein